MADPASIPAPNYTQIPNAIFDLMADKDANLKEAELRVILAIARKTFGWHKKRDKISLSQLEAATAMTRKSVKSGLDAAIERGIVRRTPDRNDKRGGFFYELVVEELSDQTSIKNTLVENLYQSKNDTSTSINFIPELVENLPPQKKEKEIKETPSSEASGGEGVETFVKGLLQTYNISETMARKIAQSGADLDTVVVSIRNNYDPKDDRTMGRILKRLVAAPPTAGKPYDGPYGKPPAQNGASPRPPKADTVPTRKLAELAKDITL